MKRQMIAFLFAAVPMLAVAAPDYSLQVLATDMPRGGGGELNNAGQFLIQREVNGGVYTYLGGAGSATVNLGTLGGNTVTGGAINDAGLVVGSSSLAGEGATHAFVYSNGAMRDIGTLGGTNSYAYGINQAGVVIGTSEIAGGANRGFIYTETGGMQDIGTLGGAGSEIRGISEAGEILGRAQTASGEWHNFLYKDGQMTDIHSWGSELYGIGSNGELYGTSYNPDRMEFRLVLERADWYPPNEWNYGLGQPAAIANGYLVGLDYYAANVLLATKDEVVRLDTLAGEGWMFWDASDVNDAGQVLAYGCKDGFGCATVLLSPVPEPATYGMLGLGLGMVALARRRKAATASRSA